MIKITNLNFNYKSKQLFNGLNMEIAKGKITSIVGPSCSGKSTLVKILIGLICGFIIDLIIKKENPKKHFEICENDHCDCDHGIILPAIKHTLKTLIFIFIITFILNASFHYIGKENIKHLFDKTTFFTPFISTLIGLIPNCGSSIILTELYIANILPLSSAISGLLANSGIALLILFKSNKNIKENVKIVSILYLISILSGLLLKIFGV